MKINKQLLLKALFYRVFAFIAIFIISLIIIGKYEISLVIAILEFISKIILYYMYEILWNKAKRYIVDL